jgi:hypothetical protein
VSDEYGLEKEHEALLQQMVEARRNVNPAKRENFRYIPLPGSYSAQGRLFHAGLPSGKLTVNCSMMDALLHSPLVQIYKESGTNTYFDISPEGLTHYADIIKRHEVPMQRVEEQARQYLLRPDFQRAHPNSYAKWAEAEGLLWDADSAKETSRIGLLGVEALTLFVDELVEAHQPAGVSTDKRKTKDRLSAVVKKAKPNLGDAESEWVDALFVYWSKVTALTQRVKHAADKEGGSIAWNDCRRAVFQTLNLMYELHDLLS